MVLPLKLIPAAIEAVVLVIGFLIMIISGLVFFGIMIATMIKANELQKEKLSSEAFKVRWRAEISESWENSLIAFGSMFIIAFFPVMYIYNVGITDVGKAAAQCRFFSGYGISNVCGIIRLVVALMTGDMEKAGRQMEKFNKDSPQMCKCITSLAEAADIKGGTEKFAKITKLGGKACAAYGQQSLESPGNVVPMEPNVQSYGNPEYEYPPMGQ